MKVNRGNRTLTIVRNLSRDDVNRVAWRLHRMNTPGGFLLILHAGPLHGVYVRTGAR